MRQLHFALIGSLLCAGAVPLGVISCSATGDDEPTGSGGSSNGSGSTTTSTGMGGTGGSTFTTGVGGSGGGGCGLTCSSDLHQVLDCQGNVIMDCPPDQGCGIGGCVPACESAMQNKSTIGCDYYSVPPDIIPEGAGTSFDVTQFARIPSGTGQSITYAPLPNGQLPAGEVAILFLSRFGGTLTSCPPGLMPAYTTADSAVHGTGVGNAFHIVTSAPVVAYDIFPYGGGQSAATSATLLLPSTAWDTNYVAVDAFEKSQVVFSAQPSIDIVAAEDNTSITISPTAAIVGGPGVPGTPQGVPQTYTLNRGQVLQFTQDAELMGSPIQSDKPIGVWGAASCLSVDVNQVACDSAHQQIPPVKALGHEYVAVRYRNRFAGQPEETPPWRIMGAVDGTMLSYEPSTPPGAPTTLSQGQVVKFFASGPFTVRSQDADHPYYISAHMTGCGETNPGFNDCRGDPEYVNVIPPQQYLTKYTFFTDPTYPETNLVVIRQKGPNGFEEVNLPCAGNLTGWAPVGSSGNFEFTRIDLVTGNFQQVGNCNNGRHVISSDAPFGLTVWGWGSAATGGIFGGGGSGFYSQAVSYAYPAGASIQPINTVVVPPVPR